MAIEIYSISLGDGMLDNDYTFYDDGTIERFYDANQWSPNLRITLTWDKIRTSDKDKIIAKTSPDILERIKSLDKDS